MDQHEQGLPTGEPGDEPEHPLPSIRSRPPPSRPACCTSENRADAVRAHNYNHEREPERIAERKTGTLASPSVNSSSAGPEPMSHRRAHCSRRSTQYNVNSGRSSSGGEGTALVATDPTSSQAASTPTGVGSTCCCRLQCTCISCSIHTIESCMLFLSFTKSTTWRMHYNVTALSSSTILHVYRPRFTSSLRCTTAINPPLYAR